MVKRSVRQLFWAAAGVAVVGLAACGSSSSTAKPMPTTSTSTLATTSTTTGVTGRTQWRDVTAEWTARAPGPFAKGPDAIAEDLAAAWRGGDTSTVGVIDVVAVRTGEPLVVVLRETGGANDAVVGTDVEITLEGGDEGWAVISARAQDACIGTVDVADPPTVPDGSVARRWAAPALKRSAERMRPVGQSSTSSDVALEWFGGASILSANDYRRPVEGRGVPRF